MQILICTRSGQQDTIFRVSSFVRELATVSSRGIQLSVTRLLTQVNLANVVVVRLYEPHINIVWCLAIAWYYVRPKCIRLNVVVEQVVFLCLALCKYACFLLVTQRDTLTAG